MNLMQNVETLASILGYLDAGRLQEAKQLTAAALSAAREAEAAYWEHCEAEERATQAWLLHGSELEDVPF